jgi:transketolase
MRKAFIQTLTDMAAQDARILLLTGDLGFMALEPFSERFPGRFFNVGVAEQNMVAMAAGLAEAGFIPFVYSIVTFAVLRPYEMIRNSAVLQRLPVRIVGIGGGMEYGVNGPSHHGLEDVAVLRTQPGITIVAPADTAQVAPAMRQTAGLPGPVYYRLGKNEATCVPGLGERFELGRAQTVGSGTDVLIVALGSITVEAAAAVDLLAAQGIGATLLVVSSLNPSPVADVAAALAHFKVALTVEAHYLNGGLGSFVSEVAAEAGSGCRVVRCGVHDTPGGASGSQEYLYRANHIDRASLAETAMAALNL